MMRKAIIAIALLSAFAAPALLAQNSNVGRGQYGPGGGNAPNIAAMVQRQIKRLTLVLQLTPGEIPPLTDLLTNNATSNQALFASMRTAEKALHTAETNNDSAGIQTASTQIGTITGQLTANRSTLNAGIAKILTPQQLAIYKALGPAGRGGGFRGGRGGFGGPGGPGGGQ